MRAGSVLVIDDDRSLREFLSIMLRRSGYEVRVAASGREGLDAMARQPAQVVLTDLTMEGLDGMAVLRAVREHWPATEVVMITAYGTTENAVAAMKEGAHDYLCKPFNVDELKLVLDKAFEKQSNRAEISSLKALLKGRLGYGSLVGRSESMLAVYDLMERVKDTPISVLVSGESGTGKELVARALHYESERRDKPFRSINCGAIPENLIEAELFGYRKGAFTGAVRDHDGLFRSAEAGTVFLDEIGEMPLSTQVKVLRVLQERRVRPVGSSEEVPVSARVVAATNRDLHAEVRAGRFREDLYYRLNVVAIELPPLRERLADLPGLIQHFLERYRAEFGRTDIELDDATRARLLAHPWPGNVRELENSVQRAIALAGSASELALEDLVPLDPRWRGATAVSDEVRPLREVMKEFERAHVQRALDKTGGHRSQTAAMLGISRKVLWEKMRDFGMLEGKEGEPNSEDV